MKVCIAGSRGWTCAVCVGDGVARLGFRVHEVVSGGARGADRLGERWARDQCVPLRQFFPDWTQGRLAGIRRNEAMAEYADALVALWDGESRGTRHMIGAMRALGKPVLVIQECSH